MATTPVFLPGESQGRGSLVGCGLWGCRVGHDCSDLAAAAMLMAPTKYFYSKIQSSICQTTGQHSLFKLTNTINHHTHHCFFTVNLTLTPKSEQDTTVKPRP